MEFHLSGSGRRKSAAFKGCDVLAPDDSNKEKGFDFEIKWNNRYFNPLDEGHKNVIESHNLSAHLHVNPLLIAGQMKQSMCGQGG